VRLAFLIDAQLPRAFCGWMRDWGHEAVHVTEVAAGDASDELIWSVAMARGLAIIS
jgi:predicted nuclease of predicted toxin-antitoxin system